MYKKLFRMYKQLFRMYKTIDRLCFRIVFFSNLALKISLLCIIEEINDQKSLSRRVVLS